MNMKELLAIDDVKERNAKLKRAFNFATLPIAIDGFEQEAVIILINITIKLESVNDVLSSTAAKQLLADSVHIEKCLSTLNYLQTHNIKYPDSRCKGVIRAVKHKAYPKRFISVEDVKPFEWSHNSADINRCLLFGASFILDNEVTTLTKEITKGNIKICEILNKLGMKPSLFSNIKPYAQRLETSQFPASIEHIQTKEVRIISPTQEYISVTPIAPYILQRDIHLACKQRAFKYTVINHSRSSSVGGFAAACGGKVQALCYLPRGLKRSLNLAEKPVDFLDKDDWKLLLEYINDQPQADTFMIRKELTTEFKEVLVKLLMNWFKTKPTSEDLTELSHQFHHWLSTFTLGHKLAYHPNLLQPVRNGLKQIQQHQLPKPKTANTYLVLQGLSVSHANAMASPYLYGVPALNAFDGFITNYCRRYSALVDEAVSHKKFAICFHQFSLQRSSISREPEPKSSKSFATPSMQDDRNTNFTVSLVIQLNETIEIDKSLLLAALPNRLAGGVTHLPITQNLLVMNSMCEAVKQVSENNQGCWLIDDSANFSLSTDKSSLSQLQKYLADNHYASPIMSGMLLLEEAQHRIGSFEGLPHVFVEPLLSVAKWQSYIKFNELDILFWRRYWRRDITYFTNGQSEATDETW